MRSKAIGLLLIVWEPLSFASEALQVVPSLGYRGVVPIIELAAHAAIAALSAGAGLSLMYERPDAQRFARFAIVLTTARVVQSLYWTVLPRNTVPGDEAWYAAAAVAVAVVTLVVLRRPS